VILIGLPGAGKSTVGKLVAARLGTECVDIDAFVVRRAQMEITQIFAQHGEARFRVLEAEQMAKVLGGPPVVVVTGGGWAAQPGALATARESGYLVYLRALAGTAAGRARADLSRPLLAGADPLEQMRQLLREREPFYTQAQWEISVEGKSPDTVAEELAQVARREAGW
jgi:shikimate kinase